MPVGRDGFLAQDVGLVCLALLISGCGDNLEKIEPVNVSLTPQKTPEGIDFESQREILESTSLAGEMMAALLGRVGRRMPTAGC